MTVLTETTHRGEFLVSEANGTLSREVLTIASGTAALAAGTVLGKITTGGKYTILAPAAADGSQNAAGILLGAVDASAADAPGVGIVRLAEVNGAEIVWPAGITGPQKTTAIAALAALNIAVR